MGADDRTDDVVGVADVGGPVADRFAGGVLQGAGAAGHGNDFSSQQAHSEHIQRLSLHVFFTHEHTAFQPEQGRNRGAGDAVLPRAGFGDDALFAHPAGKESLTEGVVDLVGAGVQQIFPFQVNIGPAIMAGQACRIVEQSFPPGIFCKVTAEFRLEIRIVLRFCVKFLQFIKRGHDGFRYETAAKSAESAIFIRHVDSSHSSFQGWLVHQ